MMNKRSWIIIPLMLVVLMLGAGGHNHAAATQASTTDGYHRPTILIHGFHAGERTYDNFIDLATHEHRAQYALTAVINGQQIHYYGDWTRSMQHPLIKVVFANNRASWDRNATWLNHLLDQLRSQYHVHSFDAVAHSRGTLDLLTAYSHSQPLQLRRAVLIAGPYDGAYRRDDFPHANHLLQNGKPMIKHPEYRELVHNAAFFPRGVRVLNIMGDDHWHGTNSDGKVANVSSKSLWPAMGPRFKSYRQLTVYGHNASHHRIIRHDNQVMRATMRFLWPTS
ncbi:alpha/beta hydrolase [Lacticaseibacillus thailandensis]|uniref:Putative cell surface hydrolase (Putative) n=1 Tax=Lacticaseibacillus thailandensis DSM 22698 = JCM 13996 TaxID=1423810 RepID=A0A0R2C6G5_9LACO|nr:alpha/beta hydrolase [Lacticaseibacillus thailandensis]KRM87224.1 putative cell surface hydrolase (putative) [Lacticaseibacillus thailandensis DSM 22698 = JCM 13996]